WKEGAVGASANKGCKGRLDLAAAAGIVHLNLQPDGAGGRFRVSQRRLGNRRIGRIDEYGNPRGPGYQLAQEFQPLCSQLGRQEVDPCQVAARASEARDKTQLDGVLGASKNEGDGRGRGLG